MTVVKLHPDTTAAVLVEIVPIGVPGQVSYRIASVGPLPVGEDEAGRILRAAVAEIDLPPAAAGPPGEPQPVARDGWHCHRKGCPGGHTLPDSDQC